ncbi:MAG: SMP-30/gluconolactonase/LRE family protein [Proteobacteria bacterium]|nr:SMP-30/gluconolactonase/LRE family protein [Pseudomonadota bacterium]
MVATLFSRLPPALHWTGEPNDWVRTTRPGQRLHSFLEGACLDARGDLWLVDVPYGRLLRIDADGAWHLMHAYDGEPHGLALRPDGSFAVADYRHGLIAFDPATGARETLCGRVNTESFRGLGDVKRAPNGDLWFTDPGRSSLSDPTGRLFRLRAGETRPELVLANLPYPNGVALSPDGVFVYVAVTRGQAVWRLLADAPDPVFPMAGVFAHLSGGLGPDGLAVGPAGQVAVAQAQAGRAYVFDALGDLIFRIFLPEGRWTTSLAFSADARSLLIVEAQHGAVWRAALPPF